MFDSTTKFMNFTMPFDWSQQNIDQLNVVHQEIQIPRNFGDYIVTKYDAYVNNIKLPDKTISIDDYSSDNGRIVHLILYKEEVKELLAEQQDQKQEMIFSVKPSNENVFPIVQFTRNAQYKVSLSWDPLKILAGAQTKFSFQVLDPYLINQTVGSIPYDFSVIEGKNGVIFHQSGKTIVLANSPNDIVVSFPSNYTGPITIAFENLNANSFADAEFSSVVSNPPNVPEFPLSSMIVLLIVFTLVILITKINRFKRVV